MNLKEFVRPIRKPKVAFAILTFSGLGALFLTVTDPAALRERLGFAAKKSDQSIASSAPGIPVNTNATDTAANPVSGQQEKPLASLKP